MRIREVSSEELDYVAVLCLDPWMPPKWREAMKPAMDARKEWLGTMMRKGLQVSVALEKSEEVLRSFGAKNAKIRELVVRGNVPKGLIEYVPIEFAPEPVKGEKSLFIDCVWVLPKFWHGGVGKGLLERFIENAKAYGGASVLAYEGDKWFGFFPYMPVGFFKKFGFKEVGRDGSRVLLHLNLGADEQPSLLYPKTKVIEEGDKVVIDVFFGSQCPWSGWMVDRIKRNVKRYDAVVNAVNTDDRKIIEEYGMSRGVCINGEPVIKRMASWKEIESVVKQAVQR
ncbi:MAG: GNAT family N-acetyltransferase [Candidatus Bathyarchaeia archaeon]|nr:GNAT family N-acetyltransferase [Candidatus Bathyarchaeia archaeon]